MEIFLKILSSKVTPLSAAAACIYAVWDIAKNNGNPYLGAGIVALGMVAIIGHFWGRSSASGQDKEQVPAGAHHEGRDSSHRVRLAMLPLIPNPENDQVTMMGDSISEQVIRSLAQINDLEVIEEHSISKLPSGDISLDEIARDLNGLDYIVKGTLRREGLNCAVTAQIYRVEDHQTLSTIEKQVPWNLLNQVPGTISQNILDTLKIETTGNENKGSVQVVVLQAGTGIAEAFESYSAGKFNLKLYNINRNNNNFTAAEQHFRKAISLDPKFADAYVELGFLHLIAWETEGNEALLKESEHYFRNALNYDAGHSTALSELGFIMFLQGRVEDGVEQAQSAIDEANPRAIPFNVLSLLYLYLGFWEESIRLTKIVNLMDPLYTYPYTNAALSCQLLDLNNESIKWAERAAEKGPGGFTSALMKGAAYFRSNRFDRAIEIWEEGRRNANDHEKFLFDIAEAWVSASQGNTSDVNRIIQDEAFEIWSHGAYAQFAISLLALSGEYDHCLALLEQEKTYTGSYRYLIADQTLRQLHKIPEFQNHLQKRYSVWLGHVHRWGNRLERPPAVIQSPEDI